MLELPVIIGIFTLIIGIFSGIYKKYVDGFLFVIICVLGIFLTLLVAEYSYNANIKKLTIELINDGKIEYSVDSKIGKTSLVLLDSTMTNTYKLIKDKD